MNIRTVLNSHHDERVKNHRITGLFLLEGVTQSAPPRHPVSLVIIAWARRPTMRSTSLPSLNMIQSRNAHKAVFQSALRIGIGIHFRDDGFPA